MSSEATLADVCSLIVDCPHNTAPESDEPVAFAVGTKAIRDGRIEWAKTRPVSAATYTQWISRARPSPGDLILCREAPVGPVAHVPKHPTVCLGQRTVLLRPNPAVADPRFVLYYLLAPTTQTSLHVLSEGSTVAHLNVADIRSFPIHLPPLEEQQAIAAVLGALDDKIDSNRRLAGLLEETAAALFKSRFVDFVGVEEFEESEIGPIPKGWASGSLADVAARVREAVRGNSALPYIGLDVMPRGSTVLTEWKVDDAPAGQSMRFRSGDVLFGKLRPYFQKVGVAPVDGRCSAEILVLRPADERYYGVMLGHVSSDAFIDFCVAVSKGTKMPRAEWTDASRFPIVIPPAEATVEFDSMVRVIYAQIVGLTHESRTLAAIRDELLPKLISGEIRVPASRDNAEDLAEELVA